MAETLILSVGMDPMVLYTREAILRSEGYIVVSATSSKEAFYLFQDGDFDLMILGKTIPMKDRERLTCLIRASGSRMPIVSIASSPWEQSLFPDATLGEDPAELVAGIRRLLAKRFELAALESAPGRSSLLATVAPATSRA